MKKSIRHFLFITSFILITGLGFWFYGTTVSAAAPIGRLHIVSDGSTKDAWYGVHAFLLYQNTSPSAQMLAGVTVQPGQSITIGTYGNKNDGKGVYVNLEAYYAKNYKAYNNRVSISKSLSSSQFSTINKTINKNNKWTSTNNCA
ncbi:MAG: hypothetical protein NC081_03455 [Roseburia sp.]|nr:hypothetical protein [Roseburia sp.]